jgi:flavin reductase (DIM6/NTAB) family NADH-FMN oxidoreductase RutF
MNRHPVPYTYHFAETMQQLDGEGLLLAATKPDGQTNVMTNGWGTIGVIWGRPIFTVLVRPSRYTYQFIEASGEFTVNVPSLAMTDFVRFCGSRSGRDHDKLAQFEIAAMPGRHVRAATIDGCPLVYECRVVQKNDVLPATLDPRIQTTYYPRGDLHRVYYGEILGVFAADQAG